MELISSFFGKIGLRKKPGKLLKSGWVITIFYALILIIGIHTFTIHRIPEFMAFYLLILLTITIISGIIWEKRTFCTHICPVGHLLGLYSMISFKELRVKDKNICKNCKTKDCISKNNHYKFTGRSCTSELYPPEIKDNKACILCGQCHKSCTKDNIIIRTRRLAGDLLKPVNLSNAEIGFFMLVSGFVVYEILSEWKVTKNILLYLPHKINSILGVEGIYSGTIKAIVLFVFIPIIFYYFFALIKKLFAKEKIRNSINQTVIALLPITASMHLIKAMLKTTSRIPYWDNVFTDPLGITTASLIMKNKAYLDTSFVDYIAPFLSVIAIAISLSGVVLSVIVINKQAFKNNLSKYITYFTAVVYASIFFITLVVWRII
jgi:ferredoxin